MYSSGGASTRSKNICTSIHIYIFKYEILYILYPLLSINNRNIYIYLQIITACKLGLIRQFDPLETICYEDKGHVSYVHFVISGECMILQCLKIKVSKLMNCVISGKLMIFIVKNSNK